MNADIKTVIDLIQINLCCTVFWLLVILYVFLQNMDDLRKRIEELKQIIERNKR